MPAPLPTSLFAAAAILLTLISCAPPPSAAPAATSQADKGTAEVREDVADAIASRFPDSPDKQLALRHTAAALQRALEAGESGKGIVAAGEALSASIKALHKSLDNADAEVGFLERAVVNNADRSTAYEKFNTGMSGQFVSGDQNQE